MKALAAFPVLAALTSLASAFAAAPSWVAGHISEVQIRDHRFLLVRTISERSEIGELARCLRRATRVGENRESFKWTHKLSVVGKRPEKGSWLYNDTTGEFTRLSKAVTPIYRLGDPDRAWLNRLLKPEAPGPPAGRMPGRRAPGERGLP